jgi:hypothetical protein
MATEDVVAEVAAELAEVATEVAAEVAAGVTEGVTEGADRIEALQHLSGLGAVSTHQACSCHYTCTTPACCPSGAWNAMMLAGKLKCKRVSIQVGQEHPGSSCSLLSSSGDRNRSHRQREGALGHHQA